MKCKFYTTCVSSTYELISAMVDSEREVSYSTMLRRCPGLLELADQLGYDRRCDQGLTLRNDWHVSYHKSRYDGKPCYYLQWSGIEHIFMEER